MKPIALVLSACFCIVSSCNERPSDTASTETKDSMMSTDSSNAATKHCYLNILKKDTVLLELTLFNNRISGNLEYKRYEKDHNKGTIEGVIKGDTLIADYLFLSEGKQSVREVGFLKKENMLIEGFGEMEEINGKLVFKNLDSLTFDIKAALKEVSCN